MKQINSFIRNRYRSLVWFAAAFIAVFFIVRTMPLVPQWLTYATIQQQFSSCSSFFIMLWHIFGGGIFFIPLSLFCFGVTRWHGVRIGYEQWFAALAWCVSSAFIAGAYHVDMHASAPGGLIGTYGARLLIAILGLIGARMVCWFVWVCITMLIAYELLMQTAHLLCTGCGAMITWYKKYRITPQHDLIDNPIVELSKRTTEITDYTNLDMLVEDILTTAHEASVVAENRAEYGNDDSYKKPNLNFFIARNDASAFEKLNRELADKAHLLTEKLERFGVSGTVVDIKRGPVVTLYEYQPHMDTKISKIIALEDDLALALQALSIRIIAPIPGRSVVGFEVANSERQPVTMAALAHTDAFTKTTAQLPFLVGVDTTGEPIVIDLARMPHLLIAGSTGSGKSVSLNTLLMSLLCSRTPDECRLILIDPKRIEFAVYADIPHLLFPIVTDARTASLVLKWVVKHMEERYALLATHGVRSSKEFNQRVERGLIKESPMPSLVVMIDELADLMMTAGRDVEDSIARIAQMARAAGIHLVVATQRPSVDVITGLIKVNFPSRMAFRVASRIDSRTILDASGADKLLGKGDMLFLDGSSAQLRRLHGAYVSDDEIHALVAQVKRARAPQYKDLQEELATIPADAPGAQDGLYHEVVAYVKEIDEISISLLQRKFRIGYNRSARLIDLLEQQGLIMPPDGVRPRKVVR